VCFSRRFYPRRFALARAEPLGQVIAEWSVGNHRGEPSICNRSDNQAKHTRIEEAASANGNRHLADNDTHWQITQNRRQWEYGHDHDDIRNIIDDQRCHRARSPTPPRCSPVRDVTPSGRVRSVLWPQRSGRLPSWICSSLDRTTNMTTLATPKNSSRSTTWSSRLLEGMI
jgi:hypothetical protein